MKKYNIIYERYDKGQREVQVKTVCADDANKAEIQAEMIKPAGFVMVNIMQYSSKPVKINIAYSWENIFMESNYGN